MNHCVTLRSNRRRVSLDLGHAFAPFQRRKIFFHQFARSLGMEIANDRQARIVRRVIELEKISHVLELRRLNIEVRTNHFTVIRMLFRKELVKQPLFHYAVRSVLNTLPPLIADYVLLVREVRLVQLVRQITHAVGLQP